MALSRLKDRLQTEPKHGVRQPLQIKCMNSFAQFDRIASLGGEGEHATIHAVKAEGDALDQGVLCRRSASA